MPIDKTYAKKVYDSLRDDVEGFDKDEATFYKLIETDKNYLKNVHLTLKDVYGDDFDKDESMFEGALGLKKKEPATTSFVQGVSKELGLKPSTPFVQSTGQELPLKTAETTTPSVSTKSAEIKLQPLNIEQIKAATTKSTADIGKPDVPKQVIPKIDITAEKGSRADLSIKRDKYTLGLEEASKRFEALSPQYEELKTQLDEVQSLYEQAPTPELQSQYNSLITQLNPISDEINRNITTAKTLDAGLRSINQLEEINREKNFGFGSKVSAAVGSTVNNLVNSTGKIIDTFGDLNYEFNELIGAGALNEKDFNDKATDRIATSIDEYYKRVNESIDKKIPESYSKYSPISDKPEADKLLYFGLNSIAQLAPTVAATLTTGGLGALATGFAMEYGGMYDTFHAPIKQKYIDQGLTEAEAEKKADLEAGLMAIGGSTVVGQLDRFGAVDMLNAVTKKALAKKITQDALVELGEKTGKEAAEQAIKKSITKNLVEFTKGYGKAVVTETVTEPVQELVAPAITDVYNAATGEDTFKEGGLGDIETWKNAGNAGIGAFLASSPAGTISGFQRVTSQGYNTAMSITNETEKEKFVAILNDEVEAGLTTPEQAEEAIKASEKIQEVDALIPNSIEVPQQRLSAVNLLMEKQDLSEQIEGKDKALSAPQIERIKAIDEELSRLASTKETTTTDGEGTIEGAISAGTDVAKEGLGMAAEPSGEGITGESVQTETVPQAPVTVEEVNSKISVGGLKGGFTVSQKTQDKSNKDSVQFKESFDPRSADSSNAEEAFAKNIDRKGKSYRVVGVKINRPNEEIGNDESGRQGMAYAMIQDDGNLPSNIDELLTKKAIEEGKNLYPNLNLKDSDFILPITPTAEKAVSEKVTEVTAPAIEVTPTETKEALRDVESTAKALEGNRDNDLYSDVEDLFLRESGEPKRWFSKIGDAMFLKSKGLKEGFTKDDLKKKNIDPQELNNERNEFLKNNEGAILSEAYHKAKTDGSNPELVKAVDELLAQPTAEPTKLPAKVEPVKEAAKPTKTERKAIAEAKIDDLAAKAKEFLRNKNLPEGTQVSGVSQNKVIDLMASTAKALVNSGIEISEAIKQVREFFEQDFDTSAVKDYEIAQTIARDELTDVAKENGFSSYREAVFAVNKYVREVGEEDVITEDEIIKAKEAKDKEASAPKKGYTSKKKKAQEGEKETVVKESGRSKSYEEGRVPVSEAYNEVVNAQKEYYEQMNQKATLAEAEEYLAQYGNSEQGLLDAYDDMMKAFRDNPFLDARNAIAIELLADRMFARALDFKKAGQSDKYNKFLEKSEDLRKEAFKAHYKAGQFNSAVGVFSRSVNPDAFLLFIDGQAKEGLENFKKTKPNVYAKYEQEVKDFQGKVKDIKKAAAQQAVVSAPNSTTKVNVKLSDKLKARYEQGKARQAEALKKLGKINFFGSSGLSNEAIEAVGELVLAQFEQGIYKAATIIERIIEVTEGKLTEKNIKDVYDAYKVNYKGEKRTLTELEEILRKEEIAEKQPATDTDKALEKEREKLAKLKADYEQAVLDKADALVLKRAQQYAKDAEKEREKQDKDKLKAAEARRKEKNRIEELRQKEEEAQSDRILALRLQRAQQFVKDQEKKIKDIEAQAKKAAIAKTSAGKRPTISDLLQRDLEADLTKEAIAKNLMTEGGLSEREANKLAEIYYNKYRKILKEKIQAQLVKDLTPRKVKEIEDQMNALEGKPFGKTLGGMIANHVAAGALDSEGLRAAFAAKYGIPNVSPIVAANIRSLSAKVRAAKTTLGVNLANKNLLTYINSTVKTKTGSIISTLYYTSILSGVSTAVVNTYGNVNNLINQSVENFVQSVIEAKEGNKGNLMSNTQGGAKIRKAVSNLVESFTSFIDIMAYGGGESRYSTMKKGTFGGFESEDLILKKKDLKDLGLKKAFIALAKLYKTPAAFFVRNLPASDEGFYMSNFNMEATRELRKKLYSEGLRGEELEKQVYEQVYGTKDIKAQAINEAIKELKRIGIDPSNRKLLVNRIAKEIILKKLDETVQNAANELAKENTFRGQPRGATGYLSQKIPQLWLVTPFVSTPFKMAEKMINYIPLYGIARYYGLGVTDTLRKSEFIDAEFKKKGIEYAKREGELRNKQLAQVLTGHLLALVFWGLSQLDWEDEDGKVVPFVDASAGYYGTGRANREKLREALPEYTIRVGNFKFSYKTNPLLAMIALPFGVIKDSERAYKEMDFADWTNVYLNKELAAFLYESTPIKGLQEFFKNIGETLDIEDEDRTWEDVAQIPVKQAAALGANLAVDNIYKQMFDFYDPTKYVVQDNKEVIYKAMNMENIGGLQTDYDRWGREIKFYPGEAFFPIQYLFKDKTDKEITDWEIKNEITIPKINRKTLVLTDRKLKTEKAIEKQKEELRKDYGIESEEYKLFEETLNADFKLLTPSEFQAYDKTVRSEVLNIIKTNFDNVTEEYKKFYKESINSEERNIKPVSKLSRPDARNLVELLFKIKKKEYINKNFTKIEVK
jgi:hypothetical protein